MTLLLVKNHIRYQVKLHEKLRYHLADCPFHMCAMVPELMICNRRNEYDAIHDAECLSC